MRDAAGQRTQAFQLLSFHVLHLGTFEIGDIDIGSDIAGESSARRKAGNAAAQQPPVLAIGPAHPVLDVEVLASIKGRTVAGIAALRIVGVDALGPAVAQLLFHGPARKDQPGFIEKGA